MTCCVSVSGNYRQNVKGARGTVCSFATAFWEFGEDTQVNDGVSLISLMYEISEVAQYSNDRKNCEVQKAVTYATAETRRGVVREYTRKVLLYTFRLP